MLLNKPLKSDLWPSLILLGGLLMPLILALSLYSYHEELTLPTLASIQRDGVLRVVTRNSPTTFYEGKNGPTGFEYALARLFADELGVRLEMQQADSFSELFAQLNKHRAVFAAAGLTITPEYKRHLTFTSPYRDVTQQLIYNRDNATPEKIEDVTGTLTVAANSSEAATLQQLRVTHPTLTWEETTDQDVVDLLSAVANKESDYTVVNSNEFDVNAVLFPEINSAFSIGKPLPMAWAFAKKVDPELFSTVEKFLSRIKTDGTLAELQERFYGHVNQLNYVGAKTLLADSRSRLPNYFEFIQESAAQYKLDWQFLAALSYQESHWLPDATSPTGVRGLMMLTEDTAAELGVTNRLDPKQSIEGGARYFLNIKNSLPERITDPDRTWLALAAYNVGLGHLEDARVLAAKQGLNPDKWVDVKKMLPLLQKPAWFSKTKHGYARGYEPVIFVQNIRRYMDVLTWASDTQHDEFVLDFTPDNRKNSFAREFSELM